MRVRRDRTSMSQDEQANENLWITYNVITAMHGILLIIFIISIIIAINHPQAVSEPNLNRFFIAISLGLLIYLDVYRFLFARSIRDINSLINEKMMNAITKMILDKERSTFPELAEHSMRCADLIKKLAIQTNYKGNVNELQVGALIHDIGKLYIPFETLSKQGEYTEEDRKIMNQHVIRGYEAAKALNCFSDTELSMVLYHHEKLNGSGYLSGTNIIPVAVQMMSVVDIYDAIVSERCYKPALSNEEAFAILDKMADDGAISKYYVDELKEIV